MRKFSYVLILAGILIMLYPKANEWYNDWQQDKLLESAELSTSESTPPPDLKSRYANCLRWRKWLFRCTSTAARNRKAGTGN